MKKYTTLYFDLDNTLLDFYSSEHKAIKSLFEKHALPSCDKTIKLYSGINKSYWEKFERGEIEKNEIFTGRFKELLEILQITGDENELSKDYFFILSSCHDVMPDCETVLSCLKKRGYTVCVTTNGVLFTQEKRIKESGLEKYFDFVFVSEKTGFQKPQKEYFDYVIENSIEKDREKILIIGDSQSSDILGGINSGIDTCWFNNRNEKPLYNSNYEIHNLKELLDIL